MTVDTDVRGEDTEPTRQHRPPEAERINPPSRRRVLRTALAAAAGTVLPSAADLNGSRTWAGPALPPQGGAMTFETLSAEAARLAAAPYAAPPEDLPPALAALDYDGYRAITFRPAESLHLGDHFSAQLFHRGFLQRKRVALYLQPRRGPARPIPYETRLFDLGRRLAGQSFAPDLGFAGFRLHYAFPDMPAWRPKGFQEEFLVFLGASYFRLRAAHQEYGLSARGLAIGTGAPEGEEFPDFVAHWICEPEPEARTLTVLSLLDSPSVAGAFRFAISPGDPARIAVTAALHPRRSIAKLGLAPLTSMFLYGQNGPGARGPSRSTTSGRRSTIPTASASRPGPTRRGSTGSGGPWSTGASNRRSPPSRPGRSPASGCCSGSGPSRPISTSRRGTRRVRACGWPRIPPGAPSRTAPCSSSRSRRAKSTWTTSWRPSCRPRRRSRVRL